MRTFYCNYLTEKNTMKKNKKPENPAGTKKCCA